MLEIKDLMKNESVKDLLTARGTTWGKAGIIAMVESWFLSEIDQLIEQYKAECCERPVARPILHE